MRLVVTFGTMFVHNSISTIAQQHPSHGRTETLRRGCCKPGTHQLSVVNSALVWWMARKLLVVITFRAHVGTIHGTAETFCPSDPVGRILHSESSPLAGVVPATSDCIGAEVKRKTGLMKRAHHLGSGSDHVRGCVVGFIIGWIISRWKQSRNVCLGALQSTDQKTTGKCLGIFHTELGQSRDGFWSSGLRSGTKTIFSRAVIYTNSKSWFHHLSHHKRTGFSKSRG